MLIVTYINNACVGNKSPELQLRTPDIDAVAVTDTWPEPGRKNELMPQEYSSFRVGKGQIRIRGKAVLLVAEKYKACECHNLGAPQYRLLKSSAKSAAP